MATEPKKAALQKPPNRVSHKASLSSKVARDLTSYSAAIRAHANASAALAKALSQNIDFVSRLHSPPLTGQQIYAELNGYFGRHVNPNDDLTEIVQGGPGAIVAMWRTLDNWPAFRMRGLRIGPNDLRYVTTVRELEGIVAWGLLKAMPV